MMDATQKTVRLMILVVLLLLCPLSRTLVSYNWSKILNRVNLPLSTEFFKVLHFSSSLCLYFVPMSEFLCFVLKIGWGWLAAFSYHWLLRLILHCCCLCGLFFVFYLSSSTVQSESLFDVDMALFGKSACFSVALQPHHHHWHQLLWLYQQQQVGDRSVVNPFFYCKFYGTLSHCCTRMIYNIIYYHMDLHLSSAHFNHTTNCTSLLHWIHIMHRFWLHCTPTTHYVTVKSATIFCCHSAHIIIIIIIHCHQTQ